MIATGLRRVIRACLAPHRIGKGTPSSAAKIRTNPDLLIVVRAVLRKERLQTRKLLTAKLNKRAGAEKTC